LWQWTKELHLHWIMPFRITIAFDDKIAVILGEFNQKIQDIYMFTNQVQTLMNEIHTLRTIPAEGCKGISRKVKVFADPREYNRFKAKFEEWWSKMKDWLMVNSAAITPGSYEAVVTVLSYLKGLKAGVFAQIRLQQGWTYNWNMLVDEMKGLFRSTNQKG